MDKVTVHMVINEKPVTVEVLPYLRLIDLLRDELGLTGTKEGCGVGGCGACTVLVNGKNINSCLALAVQMEGKSITTIEGLMKDEELHPIQKAFIECNALQCGFCTPGLIMSTKALLDKKQNPSKEEIKVAISGNLCRCTGYEQVIEAVRMADAGYKRAN